MVKVHPTAEVSEKAKIGEGTSIWHQAQVREDAEIGNNCNIGKGVYIDTGVKIGSRCKIQNYVSVYNGATLEDDVFVGPGATFTNDAYPRAFLWDESRLGKTLVKKGASIGANATVICGVKIGKYAMVGAGSVVTKDVPDNAMVFGNPADFRGFVCECGHKVEKFEGKGINRIGRCMTCGKTLTIKKESLKKV